MMKSAILASLVASAAAFAPSATSRASTSLADAKADLESFAKELNPVIGFYDPLDLASLEIYGRTGDFTAKFLRHAEIKHGRVAMAAFVGYCVQSNFHWPWAMTLDGDSFPSTDLSPPEQWDALPFGSKLQIIGFIGFLEIYSELTPAEGTVSALPHYTSPEGVPGKFPEFGDVPHPVPFNLFDPFKLSANKSEEAKARGLVAETNNGRLAQIAILAFLAADKVEGSVPALTGIAKPYAGDVMAPFEANFHLF